MQVNNNNCCADFIVVTACSSNKADTPKPARELYKSTRIKKVDEICRRYGVPLYILSGKYGLICGDEIIEPYDQKMDFVRALELIPQIKNKLEQLRNCGLEEVVFYGAGANKAYHMAIEQACLQAHVKLTKFGRLLLAEIRDLERYVDMRSKQKLRD